MAATTLLDPRREGIIHWAYSMKEAVRQMKIPFTGISVLALRLKFLESQRLHPHYYHPRFYNAEDCVETRFEYTDRHWVPANAFLIVEVKQPAVLPSAAEQGYWDR